MKKKEYRYFVSYIFVAGSTTGFGNTFIAMDKPIKNTNDIQNIQTHIVHAVGTAKEVIVLYYQQVSEEE